MPASAPRGRPPRTRWGGAALVGLAAATALSACSSGGGDGGAATPQVAVETFFHAIGDKDPGKACSVVSSGGTRLSGTPLDQCELGFQKVLDTVQDQGDIALLKGATVTGATITGDRATILSGQITKVPDGFQNDIDLVRLGGRWYIDSKTDSATDSPTDTPTDTPAAPTG